VTTWCRFISLRLVAAGERHGDRVLLVVRPSTATRPRQFKQDSMKAYLMCFGTSGMFEQDDVENWTSITNVSRGRLAATVTLDTTMGMPRKRTARRPSRRRWPAPGQAYVGYGE